MKPVTLAAMLIAAVYAFYGRAEYVDLGFTDVPATTFCLAVTAITGVALLAYYFGGTLIRRIRKPEQLIDLKITELRALADLREVFKKTTCTDGVAYCDKAIKELIQ